jgi:predicted MFS family arabinose efflux permease
LVPVLVAGGWVSSNAAGSVGAANLAGYIVGAALGVRGARRAGVRQIVRLGLVCATAGVLLSAAPLGTVRLLGWCFVGGFAGGLLMVVAAPAALGGARPAEGRRTTALVFSGRGLGMVLSGTLVPMLARVGVAAPWLGLGLICAGASAATWPAWPDSPRATFEGTEPSHEQRAVRLLLASYACSAIGLVPHIVFLADFVARGLARGVDEGGWLWVALGVGAILGPIVVGSIPAGVSAERAFGSALAVQALAALVPGVAPAVPLAVLSAVVMGALIPAIPQLALGAIEQVLPAGAQAGAWGR